LEPGSDDDDYYDVDNDDANDVKMVIMMNMIPM
jgi:hypothetical protein